jgi:hypothetical protein
MTEKHAHRWLYLLPFFITWLAASLFNFSEWHSNASFVECGITSALAMTGYSLLVNIGRILDLSRHVGPFILILISFLVIVKGGTVFLLWKDLTNGDRKYLVPVSLLMPVWLLEAIWLGDWML